MFGYLITIVGIFTAFRMWGGNTGLAIFTILVTLYQASSLREMNREVAGMQPTDRWQTTLNMISSIIIIGLAFIPI